MESGSATSPDDRRCEVDLPELLPSDWPTARLGELFAIQQGKALSPRARLGERQRPFLRTANVLWGRVDLTGLDHMHFDEEEEERLALEPGDLLVCEGGDIGRTALWEGELPGVFYQNHLHRLRARHPFVHPPFYVFWMQAAWTLLGLYGGTGNRTTIPNLSRSRLASLCVPVPPLAEQRAITHVLEAIRAVKETTEKVHAGLEALQRSLTHHLLAYGPSPLNQSIHEPIPPSHWTTLPLGKAVRRVKGRKPPVVHAQPQPGSLPYLTAECLRTGATELFVDAQTAAQLPTCGPGDVLLLWDGANAGQAFRGRKGVLASTMVRLDPIPDLEKGFLYHFLRSQFPTLNGQTTGSTIPHVNKVVFENLPLPLPPLAEQQAMVAPLQAIEDRLEAERSKLKALEEFFRSLLRELVTGRRRLPEAFVVRFREEGGAA